MRLRYLRELDERRAAIIDSHRSAKETGAALKAGDRRGGPPRRVSRIAICNIAERRRKAQIARESGFEPLVKAL